MDNFFKVENIRKIFGKLEALSDVTFQVAHGEVMGIIGPNGAGKTTLFSVASGFYKPDSGRITFLDQDVTGKPPEDMVKLGLCRTFQIPKPFKELSVYDNLNICTLFNTRLRTLGIIGDDYIREILKNLDLISFANQPASTLGYGNLKRLELGRALATVPKILLLDEPFAGLSTSEIESMSQILVNIKKERDITILIVEHKLHELMKIADRITVLHYGKKIAEGTPESISRNNLVLESYLGKRWKLGVA